MLCRVVSWILALAVVPAAFAQPPSAASIVERFYPQSLSRAPDAIARREQCFAVYEAEASGAPRTIVAAYTNHADAVIRVLRSTVGGFEVAAEPQGLDLSGVWCEVTLVDLDADGRREVRVDFSANRDTASWVFRWDGEQLRNLTPTTTSTIGTYRATSFVNGDFVDVDNDGTKEIYVSQTHPRYPDEPLFPAVLYRLRDGLYVEETPLVGMWRFVRNTGAAETTTVSVTVPRGALGPYTLRVVNGLPDKTARAASAQVWMNRKELLSQTDFGPEVATIDRAIALETRNELAVRFAGQPSSEMLIIIESRNWK